MKLKYLITTLILIFLLAVLPTRVFADDTALSSSVEVPVAGSNGNSPDDTSGSGNETTEPDYFTGAATNRIKLEVLPGRAGMQPDLVLNYNSHRRDSGGIVGFGWELNPGYIERSTANGVSYAGIDFVLAENGSREELIQNPLVPSGGCREYNLKIETGGFVRYFNCGDHWIAYDKQGRSYTYGSSPNTRLQNESGTQIFRWYLEEIADQNGNKIKFDYSKNLTMNDSSSIVLSSIYYTGHTSTSTYPLSISFSYSFDHSRKFINTAHFEIRNMALLDKITMSGNDGTYLNYKFGYEWSATSDTSLLKSLQLTSEHGSEKIELPTRTFEYSDITADTKVWGNGSDGRSTLSDDDLAAYDDTHGFMDVNGDGFVDRIVGKPGFHKFDVYYGSSTGFNSDYSEWADGWNRDGIDGVITGSGSDVNANIVDMNGDMLPDRVYGGPSLPLSSGEVKRGFIVEYNDSEQWGQYKIWDDPICDVKADFCGSMSSDAMLMDVTGDGLPDRILKLADSMQIWRNLGDRFSSTSEEWSDPAAQWRNQSYFRDMNGDHLVDLVVVFSNGIIRVFPNTGQWWSEYGAYYMSDPVSGGRMDDTAALIDVNNDGKADRVVGSPATGKILVYFNSGTNFKFDGHLEIIDFATGDKNGKVSYGDYPGLLDVNGDGYLDRIVPNGGSADFGFFKPAKGQALYLLKKINNGLGVTTDIEYTPSTKFLNNLLPMPIYVVTKVTMREGNEVKETNIRYAGGHFYPDFYNPAGRKFEGFSYVEIWDPLGNITQRWYGQTWDNVIYGRLLIVPEHMPSHPDYPVLTQVITSAEHFSRTFPTDPWGSVASSGKLLRETVFFDRKDGSGIKIHRETVNYWKTTNTDETERRFVYLGSSVKKEFAANNASRELKQEWNYDTQTGNLLDGTDLYDWIHENTHRIFYSDYLKLSIPGIGDLVTSKAKTIVAKEVDEIKNTTIRIFDSKGNLTTITRTLVDPVTHGQRNVESQYTYDQFGNVLSVTDPLGRTTNIQYETVYNTYPKVESAIVSGQLFETNKTYNGTFGKVTSATTPDGRTWTTTYDSMGRVKEKKFRGTWIERYDYVDITQRASSSQFLTAVKKYTNISSDPDSGSLPREVTYRDGQGRVIAKLGRSERASGEYRTVGFRYRQGSEHNITYIFEPEFQSAQTFAEASGPYTWRKYDGLNRLVSETPPTGEASSPTAPRYIAYGVDINPWATKYTDELGKEKTETKNSRGQVINVTEVASTGNITTRYAYDFWGNRTNIFESGGKTATSTFDNLGRKVAEHDFDRGDLSYKYDDAGNMTERTDARGAVTRFTYDEINRVKTKNASGAGLPAQAATYTYDTPISGNYVKKGELSQIVDDNGYTNFSYNDWGGVEKVKRNTTGLSGTAVAEYDRDFAGRVNEMKYPGNKVHLKYDYDRAGNVSKVTRIGSTNEELYSIPANGYDERGHLLAATYGNGINETYTYYSRSQRLYNVKDANATDTIRQLSYSYNSMGDVISINDGVNTDANVNNASLGEISYDDLHRVTGYKYYQGANGGQSAESYTYDNFGNLKTNSESFGATAYTYNVANHAHAASNIGSMNFAYDAVGNLTQGRGRKLYYDAGNLLTKVELDSGMIVEYGYGGLGERLYKKIVPVNGTDASTTYYLGNYLEIQDGNLVHNVYAGNKLIATIGEGRWGDGVAKIAPGWEHNRILAQNFVYCPTLALMGIAVFAIPLARRRTNKSPLPLREGVRGRGLSPLVILNLFQDLAFTFTSAAVETFIQLGLDTRRKLVAATIIVTLFTPATLFAYEFPSDVEDTWPTDDGSFMVYVHLDHLRSSNLMTEGKAKGRHNGIRFIKGEIVQRIEYTPFGKERYVLNPTLKQGPKFTDQLYDVEDGLYFYQSRYYDAVLGRFIQPDSAPSEMLFQNQGSQELNRYSYAINNPLKFTDPTGHYIDPDSKDDKSADEKSSSDDIDKQYKETMESIERTKQKMDKIVKDFGKSDEGGSVRSEYEGHFHFEDEDVERMAEAGRMRADGQNLGSGQSFGSQIRDFFVNNFNEKTLLRNAFIGAAVWGGVGLAVGGPAGLVVGAVAGFGGSFIISFHIMEIVKNPAAFLWPFYDERTTPTPDRNENHVADIYE